MIINETSRHMKKKVIKRKGKEYVPARQRTKLTPGDAIRLMRELKEWTQKELASRTGISAQNISMLENNRIPLGRKRALLLAKAFGVHPGTLMFPDYVPAANNGKVA
jgi:DNA-binding XRE family transcriptional regulator